MSTSARKKAERIKRMKEEAKLAQRMRELASAKPTKREFGEYKFPDPVGYNDKEKHKSLNSGQYNTFKAEDKVYTGTLIKGIGTMHKSNAVPILSQEEAIDIATMRRN